MFNIDFHQLADQCLAYFMRQARTRNLLYSVMKPLKDLYDDYTAFQIETIYELGVNYQVVNLERLLNDKFNTGMAAYTYDTGTGLYAPVAGAIYIIDDPDTVQPVYIWNKIENRPLLFIFNKAELQPPTYLHNEAEFAAQTNFIVMIPTSLIDITTDLMQVAQIKAWLDKFKLAGKKYKLQNY